jgi:hypothetical protein
VIGNENSGLEVLDADQMLSATAKPFFSSDHPITGSPDHPMLGSPDHPIIRSADNPVRNHPIL